MHRADVDADGDLDMVVGVNIANAPPHYYENVGSPTSPIYVERNGTSNPWANIRAVGNLEYAYTALADYDGDGDIDYFQGESDGTIWFYENVGQRPATVGDFRNAWRCADSSSGQLGGWRSLDLG